MWYFWIRKQVRRVMRPIPLAKADKYNKILTLVYVFSAWTAFGITFFYYAKSRSETDPSFESVQNSGFYYGKVYRTPNLQIFRFTGGQLVKDGSYSYNKDAEESQEKDEFFGKEELN